MKRVFIEGKNLVKPDENDPYIQTAKKSFVEYCENCSIHGVRYFTERKRHWSERLWWIVAFGVSLWLCGSSIKDTWIKWHANPVTMSWNGLEVPISDIPFPTVTICPETKTNKEQFNISDAINNSELSPENSTRLDALTHICPLLSELFLRYPKENFKHYANEDIYQTLEDMAPKLSQTIFTMHWQNKVEFSRSEFIVPVLTENGLCFTFNALNSREIYTEEMAPGLMIVKTNSNMSHWTLDDGYEEDPVKEEYPIRVTGSGQIAALDLGLILYERDFDYSCRGFDQGFLVTLTTPGETLKLSSNSLRVPILENTLIKIYPKLTTTSNGLLSYKPNRRQCFFAFERRLRFFKMYTQNNCEAECLSNFTKNECKCVKFSMPRDVHTKICGPGQIECYRNAEKILLTNKKAKSFGEECNCLPECTKIEYNTDIDRVKYDWTTIKSVIKADELDGGPQLANLAIFFQNQQVETITRMEVSTYIDFLAVCGGLLGLFLGVSALSIIEFIYYSTLRLFWTFHQLKPKNTVEPFRQHIHAPRKRPNFQRNTQFDRSGGKF